MRVEYSRHFVKTFKKCPQKIQVAFRAKLAIFLSDQFAVQLNNHALTGKYFGYRSINITGDWRAVFEQSDDDVFFITLGTHSQLYG